MKKQVPSKYGKDSWLICRHNNMKRKALGIRNKNSQKWGEEEEGTALLLITVGKKMNNKLQGPFRQSKNYKKDKTWNAT